MALNIKLIEKIREKLEEAPTAFDMSVWTRKDGVELAPCGTIACIAGWAVLLETPKEEWNQYDDTQTSISLMTQGQKALGIETLNQAARLFAKHRWPKEYQKRVEEERNRLEGQERWDGTSEANFLARVRCERMAEATVARELLASVIEKGGVWWKDEE